MGLPGIYFIDTNGKKENKMPQKIIKEDSPFEFLGQHLEVAYRRGELLGLKKAILELTKLENKIEETLREMEGKLDESNSQDK
tara:strand:+ start:105 stop:353 length:249 start_codon:yes stop_codon:yes gene_type:complete